MHSLTQASKVDPKGKRALVLGSGGAARSITVELALAGVRQITIVNRSSERGEALTELLNSKTPARANFIQWQGTYFIPSDTDILVNATSIGLFPNVDERPNVNYDSIHSRMVVCDVIHTPTTPFLREAQIDAQGSSMVWGCWSIRVPLASSYGTGFGCAGRGDASGSVKGIQSASLALPLMPIRLMSLRRGNAFCRRYGQRRAASDGLAGARPNDCQTEDGQAARVSASGHGLRVRPICRNWLQRCWPEPRFRSRPLGTR